MSQGTLGFPCATLLAALLASNAAAFSANSSDTASLMRRQSSEQLNEVGGWTLVNPPENKRTYSSIWGNNAIGTGHARSMINSGQAWSAARNDNTEWMTMDMGSHKAVGGVYIQSRHPSPWGSQRVTMAHFEYSKDCKDYTPIEDGRQFWTGVHSNSNHMSLIKFTQPVVARCVKLCVDGWSHHVSVRAGLYARTPQGEDKESVEYLALNPAENKRTYSSVWGNQAVGTGHARSMLDSVQAWSSRWNNQNAWMTMDLGRTYKVRGVFIQARKKTSGGGNQMVRQASFETSTNCQSWTPVEDGKVFVTNVQTFKEVKYLVPWSEDISARCIKIKVDMWYAHISMRAGAAVSYLSGTYGSLLEQAAEDNVTVSMVGIEDMSPIDHQAEKFYGDGSEPHVAEDFDNEKLNFSAYGDGMPTHIDE